MELTAKNMLLPKELPNKFDIEIKAKACMEELIIQNIPGDKSISQRAILLNSLANGMGKVKKVLKSRDIFSCMQGLRELGVPMWWEDDDLVVQGVGLTGFTRPKGRLYMDNSATSTRILLAILAGCPFETEIGGNPLLSCRSMQWAAAPLIKMGADITFLEKHGYLPLAIKGRNTLNPISVEAAVASAQEKSVVLFAGLFADGVTQYRQLCQSRDHTERMMRFFGLPIVSKGEVTQVSRAASYEAKDIEVPGDISSAAFMITAYLIRKGIWKYNMTLKKIGVNDTRLGYINQLKKMGAQIEFINRTERTGEPEADIICTPADTLRGIEVEENRVIQSMIDEIPLLAAIAAYAKGKTVLEGCGELKDKDTDRIQTTAKLLRSFGADIETSPSRITVYGGKALHPARVSSYGDHRIAMTGAVLGSSFKEPSYIENFECILVSYPTFLLDLSQMANIRIIPV